MSLARSVLVLWLGVAAGCAGGTATVAANPTAVTSTGEAIVAKGGALDAANPPAASVVVEGDGLVVWGMTEVPGASRLQAAEAMADAAARSEVAKYLAAGLISAARELDTDQGPVDASTASAELTAALLPGLAPPQRGWVRLRRDNEIILRVVARLVVKREQVSTAVSQIDTLSFAGEAERLRAFIDRLF